MLQSVQQVHECTDLGPEEKIGKSVKILFYPPPRLSSLFYRDYAKTTELISIKFYKGVDKQADSENICFHLLTHSVI